MSPEPGGDRLLQSGHRQGRCGLGRVEWAEEGGALSPVPSSDSQCLASANVQKESKENQWLGVSVQSQGPGGKIVVSITSCDS